MQKTEIEVEGFSFADLDLYSSNNIAMRVAQVDRIKFNEAVADNYYRCAPTTVGSAPRDFDGTDIIGMYIFGRLNESGYPARHAGNYACAIVEALRGQRKVEPLGDATPAIFFVARDHDGEVAIFPRLLTAEERERFPVALHIDVRAISRMLSERFNRLTTIWKEAGDDPKARLAAVMKAMDNSPARPLLKAGKQKPKTKVRA